MTGLREARDYLAARPLDPRVEGLLLEAARPETARAGARLEAGAATWDTVLALAESHASLPTCAFRLVDAVGLPAPAADRLARVRDESVALDRLQVAVLGDLLDAFRAAGLPVMVLKGARIAERLYARPAARVGKDIDLLIRLADRPAAGEILAARGFTCRDQAYYESQHFHHTWVHGSRVLAERVELHWDVTLPGASVRFPM
nr:nucleotidyltransferase family protein [Acidobacteriota bacterium]